ncbi:MAG: cytidine deaminase [Burkholderiales bacterium]
MGGIERRDIVAAGLAAGLAMVAGTPAAAAPADGKPSAALPPPVPDAALAALVERARAAAANAYAPYSRFTVGAAVLADDGQVFAGCNVENASYGLTICAERNAVFRMVAEARRQIRAVAIYTPTKTPTAPCGACRQVLNEFGPDAVIVSACDAPERTVARLSELLPGAFGPANLK